MHATEIKPMNMAENIKIFVILFIMHPIFKLHAATFFYIWKTCLVPLCW